MVAFATTVGNRKIALGWGYLFGVFCLYITVVVGYLMAGKPLDAPMALALGSMGIAPATGVGMVVWGNVQEHRCKNGHGDE